MTDNITITSSYELLLQRAKIEAKLTIAAATIRELRDVLQNARTSLVAFGDGWKPSNETLRAILNEIDAAIARAKGA